MGGDTFPFFALWVVYFPYLIDKRDLLDPRILVNFMGQYSPFWLNFSSFFFGVFYETFIP
jgi:hypothetical protein